jgi:hypothetical protein
MSTTDLSNIWQFNLRKGNSPDPTQGACLLDAVSWFEYGTIGDRPPCVCPVIAAFARGINDVMSDGERQRLKAFLPRLPGTVDPDREQARAEYLAWQAIRVFVPLALDAAGLHQHGQTLREFSGALEQAAAAAAAAACYAATAARYAASAAAARYAASAVAARYAASAAAAAACYAATAARYAASAAAARYAASAVGGCAMIEALDGVLAIGRQAEPVTPGRWEEAQRTFALARAAGY